MQNLQQTFCNALKLLFNIFCCDYIHSAAADVADYNVAKPYRSRNLGFGKQLNTFVNELFRNRLRSLYAERLVLPGDAHKTRYHAHGRGAFGFAVCFSSGAGVAAHGGHLAVLKRNG